MPVITAIERIKFKRRADIWLEGERAFSLSLELIALARLEAGQELEAGRQEELRARDEREQAMAAALRLLSLSPRSERDLRQRFVTDIVPGIDLVAMSTKDPRVANHTGIAGTHG